MRARRRLAVAVALGTVLVGALSCRRGPSFSQRLTDAEFLQLSDGLSEPPGVFTHSENLVSNERNFVNMIPMFDRIGGVYVGVGPEQNFHYIAAMEPAIAFIVDIRRENLSLHLLYKALFEMTADRAEFLSRLFSRERPGGVGPDTSVQDLFARYAEAAPSDALRRETSQLVRQRLLELHAFPLASDDLEWMDHVLDKFSIEGPDLQYEASRENRTPTYRELMTETDVRGASLSYLATEANWAAVRDLQVRNLIVPLVGNFGGRDALRHVADYTRDRGGIVSVFYGSNVQVYLSRDQRDAFCDNLESLPTDARSWFIGSNGMERFPRKVRNCRLK